MMRFPSFSSLWEGALRVFARFPTACILALVAAGLGYTAAQTSYQAKFTEPLLQLMAVCNLALTLTLAGDLFSERQSFGTGRRWALRLGSLAIAALLEFALDPIRLQADVFRMCLLAFSFHLLVAFAPFIGKNDTNGFWQYNKTLFLRFLTSALYSGVLIGGLCIALAAIDALFNVEIRSHIYLRLFAVIGTAFNTIFFLAGVPKDFVALNEDHSYPKGLKIFTQYVLIPLITIYLGILLLYEVKIALEWRLPKGTVSNLITGYAVFGILSLLLIYPIREQSGNRWIVIFSRLFYFLMIPLLVLLVLAIWKRVGLYGITESRYILILMAFWLSGITIYFLVNRQAAIKVIPISLFVITLLGTFGPQSMVSVSKRSQLGRLKALLSSKQAKDQEEKRSIILYMLRTHGLVSLQPLTEQRLQPIADRLSQEEHYRYYGYYNQMDTALAIFQVPKYSGTSGEYITLHSTNKGIVNAKAYDYLVVPDMRYQYVQSDTIRNTEVTVAIRSDESHVTVRVDNTAEVSFDLHSFYQEIFKSYGNRQLKAEDIGRQTYYYPEERMRFNKSNGSYDITLMITETSCQTPGDDSSRTAERGNIRCMIGLKRIR
ncbi:DUF4153 domain-containing protein [Chitinophaga pendula]|uniref:DUF4153 domain-containing protein n=1 Tax=Chitinophaga TaxID=79328 RepID=UPI000BAF863F|nr:MULTISPECIES: DUF4153 domain-containing protein [Chitinophaga]ASZ12020.1 DUF4153 domain-containing protein [Chitinophaga sp. MD30]UCJ04947.1 DUF4153 domain-containing protein [Chitinophaga pendula]